MRTTLFIALLLQCSLLSCAQKKDTAVYDARFIRFHEYGKGDAIILLSGGPGNNCRQLEDLAIKLGEKYHAILLEQRGTGLSMPAVLNEGTINIDFSKRDILFIMDSLKIKKTILLGHSWGAILATAFADSYPGRVQLLVLIGPGPMSYEGKYWDQLLQNRIGKLTKQQWKQYLSLYTKVNRKTIDSTEMKEYKWLNAAMSLYDTTHAENILTQISKGERNQQTFLILNMYMSSKEYNLTNNIPALRMPVSIITGKEDPLAFLTTEYHRLLPAATIYWIEKSGHFPMFEQPEKFYAVLQEALASQ